MEDQTAKEIREDYLTNPIYDGEVHQVIGGMSMEIQNLREEITRLKKETPKPDVLDWHKFQDKHFLPLDTLCLFEVEVNNRQDYQTGSFVLNAQGQRFGVIGHHFYFDCNIIRWANINHLIPEEAND